MPDVPLSRRARRDMEAQAAELAAAQDDASHSPAPGTATGDIPGVDTGAQAFSRRNRRRVERLARPMESWTAEEEMIATGHIPAMTPERIAEQEKLAREAAERAAADAQTASAELRILAQRDLVQQRPVDDSTPPVRVSSADIPLVKPAPRVDPEAPREERAMVEPYSPRVDPEAPREERAMVEPYSPRFELDDSEMKSARADSGSVEVPTGFDPEARIERTPAPTGEPDSHDDGDLPIAWPENFDGILAPPSEEGRPTFAAPPTFQTPAFELPVAVEAPEEKQADAAAREAEAAAARAKVFEELFPPGSSQAALLAHDQREHEAAASARSAEPIGSEPAQDDDEAERQRGIEEIRRLTEVAINSMEKKSQPLQESTQPESTQPESTEPESAQPLPVNRFEMPAEPEGEHAFRELGAPASPPEWEQLAASPMPDPGALAPTSGQFPVTPAPHQATFDDTVRAASTEIPVRPMNQPQPTQEQAPSQWGSHPLDAVQASAINDVNNFEPVSDAPRPDLSQLNNWPPIGQSPATGAQSPTTGGQVPTTGALFNVDPSATGQIAPLRRTPDLPPVGGAKHFKWLHLAVIGALVFVLGVVIYNVAFGQ